MSIHSKRASNTLESNTNSKSIKTSIIEDTIGILLANNNHIIESWTEY